MPTNAKAHGGKPIRRISRGLLRAAHWFPRQSQGKGQGVGGWECVGLRARAVLHPVTAGLSVRAVSQMESVVLLTTAVCTGGQGPCLPSSYSAGRSPCSSPSAQEGSSGGQTTASEVGSICTCVPGTL